ncbi:MAG: glycosyltransferase [Eubacteriales bacterium]|nr:glycosyltransferase [Eubacteriales bacterium]
MDIKRILLPEQMETDEALYYRRSDGVSVLESGALACPQDAEIDFHTYFNSFSTGKWKKYTVLEQVELAVRIQGNFCISLRYHWLEKGTVRTKVLTEANISSEKSKQFIFHFGDNRNNGTFSFLCRSMRDGSVFLGGKYFAEHLVPVNLDINLAADICTFRKEAYVERNMRVLKKAILENPESPLYRHLYVFISDNAGTLNPAIADGEYIRIAPSRNVGGVGGFTRGIIEAKALQKARDISHVLLMDDDAVLEPAALETNYIFLSLLKPEYKDYLLGGAILRQDRPYMQYESGAQWNRGDILALRHFLDLRQPENLLLNEQETETAEYTGWWYTCIPLNVIENDNLPLPLFIHRDDVEYGLRIGKKKFIFLNGICVWHEAFENKMAGPLEYYDIRNLAIVNAVHFPDYGAKEFKRLLFKWASGNIARYRYKYVDLNIRGVEDFLKGVDWFKNQEPEALHKELAALNYQTKPKSEYIGYKGITEEDYNWEALTAEENFRQVSKVRKFAQILSMNGYFLPAKKKKAMVVPPYNNIYQTFRVEEVVFTDAAGNSVLTKRSLKEFFTSYRKLFAVFKLIDQEYETAKKSYREHYKELTSMSFWHQYLNQ